ncbi:uncharacterized protein LOC129716671 [Wyeomyia smithii]|uniref:uncharacterized protein LOC129716671 n=1 Tax=Wyeomyia smithii TaxID=174621 RepID=UPI002467AD73|nr:uncharacterized protein LOC129716671 [Wyeomyia smithii]
MAQENGTGLEINSLFESSVLESVCPFCNAPDDGKMINCDNCNQWFHFNCVGVSESESERDWNCAQCHVQVTSGHSTPAERTRQESERNQLACIQELRKQIGLLQRRLAYTEVRENQRVQFNTGSRPNRNELDANSTGVFPKANSTTIDANKSAYENDEELEDGLRLLEEKHALEKRQLQERFSLLQRRRSSVGINQTGLTTANSAASSSTLYNELSRSQLAARQAVARDLPVFYGHPEEWPLFHASFESSTRMCGYSDEENLLRLQRCLKGKALEAVRSRLLHPSNLSGIMSTLKTLFGRPEVIVHSLVTRIREMPSPKAEKLNTLIDFGVAIQNVCATIKACGLDEYLCNVALLQELVDRLPPAIKLNWALHRQSLQLVTLSSFGDWLEKLVEAACVVTISPVEPPINRKNRKQDDYLNVHSEETKPLKPTGIRTAIQRCVICEGACSSTDVCKAFINMSISSRWSALREKRLCKKCLNKHFGACIIKSSCGRNGCTFMHHPMLHDDARYKAVQSSKQPSSQSCNAHCGSTGKVLFRYIPIILHGKDVSVRTYAFLDDGSSATFMDHSLVKELNLEGMPSPLCLNWTGGQQREERESVRLTLKISGLENHCKKFVLPKVHTVRTLSLPLQSISVQDLSRQYAYLKGLPVNSYDSVSPRILIGIDNCHVGNALKSVEGAANEPVATKTRLGWLIYGPCSVSTNTPGSSFNACHSFHICPCFEDGDSCLNTELKKYFSMDSLGIVRNTEPLLSKEDERATQLLQSRTHRKGNRYETGLLWRRDGIELPDSKSMAEKRLVCLERRMSRDDLLAKTLEEKIREYESKGFIRKLSPKEVAEKHPRKWYLPIFPVMNPNKPGKVRIVWDAAARVGGLSLNSVLLTGPDQLASLPSVLYRFREYRFAIAADIREMFHQVEINEDDQQSQRFLWRDGDSRRSPDVYIMKVMTFGATCSPSCAQFVKNTNAARFQQQFPRAVACIQKDHYVDDLLTSEENEDEAIQLASDVRFIHAQGGFELHNWLSNSNRLLETVSEAGAVEKDLNLSSEMATEKVLGMWWSISSDTFTFKLSPKHDRELLSGQKIPTKRELLKTLMRIYDPLGLMTGFLMFLKILLQEVWRAKTDWDAEIPPGLADKWMEWLKVLPQAERLSIPRCYRQTTTAAEDNVAQLHIFVDAGRDGLVAVAYLRFEQAGTIECALVGAKARVAPLKYVSVPRLELQAAVIGTRMAASIAAVHRVKISERYFWTDSRDVICWIISDHRRYSTYVAHRRMKAQNGRKYPTLPHPVVGSPGLIFSKNQKINGR